MFQIQEIKVKTDPLGDASAEIFIVEISQSPPQYGSQVYLYEPTISYFCMSIPILQHFHNPEDAFEAAVEKIYQWSKKYSRNVSELINLCGYKILQIPPQQVIVNKYFYGNVTVR